MSAQVKKVLSPLKPVCNIVKSNSGILTALLFLMIAFTMIPLNLVWKTDIQKEIRTKVTDVFTSSFGQLFIFLLFICLYMNGDVENMVLLLYVLWLTDHQ